MATEQTIAMGWQRLLKRFPSFALAIASVLLLAACGCSSRPPRDSLLLASNPANNTTTEGNLGRSRRSLMDCPPSNIMTLLPYLTVDVVMKSPPNLEDDEIVTVLVDGIRQPDKGDWIGMMIPGANLSLCPSYRAVYEETGDHSDLPLLCTYPIKSQFLSNDPDYLPCNKWRCGGLNSGLCEKVCGANLTFHITNLRSKIQFFLFIGGFDNPCPIAQSREISFKNLFKPLYPHLSSNDSSGTTMRVTWVSASNIDQYVKYSGDDKTNITIDNVPYDFWDQCNLCGGVAANYGFKDPGYIRTAVMTGLKPSHEYSYSVGSDVIGWTTTIRFRTPPAGGSNENVCFLVVADMGRASLDNSVEHYTRPAALPTINAMVEEVAYGTINSIFHLGGLSYATGFLVSWEYFLRSIEPMASRVPYMTAIGNHERDYPSNQTMCTTKLQTTTYSTIDSGGECGVPYGRYFQMPNEFLGNTTDEQYDKPWYSIEQGNVHFTIISTEHDWNDGSEQYTWFKNDVELLDRSKTPWLIVMGHRPMYSSVKEDATAGADPEFRLIFEDHLHDNQVDLAIFGHVYNYERSCAVYQANCLSFPIRDEIGVDVYNNTKAPIHLVLGTGGFSLEDFSNDPEPWSVVRMARYGYLKVNATGTYLEVQFIDSMTMEALDYFVITKTDYGGALTFYLSK